MVNDNVNLVDREYNILKKPQHVRKIKFKNISFKNISGTMTKFRLRKLKEKLEEKQIDLVTTEIKTNGSNNISENKILRKATAIAKLEAKINFLETGEKQSKQFINSRAIKLKDNMMKNMVYNCKNAYSVPDEKLDDILAENKNKIVKGFEKKNSYGIEPKNDAQADQIVQENEEKLAKSVQQILHEDSPSVEDEKFETPSREEMKQVVDGIFERESEQLQGATNVIDKKDVDAVIKEQMGTLSNPDENRREDIEKVVTDELAKVKVSKNSTTVAKINKFINDDGTYRLKREDIDEDFRITRTDGQEYKKELTNQKTKYNGEGDISEINTEIGKAKFDEVKKPIIKTPTSEKKEDIRDINEDIFGKRIEAPENNTVTEEKNTSMNQVRELPAIVPERIETKQDKFQFLPNESSTGETDKSEEISLEAKLNKTVDSASSKEDLEPLISWVQKLQEQQARTRTEVAKAEESAQEAERKYKETINMVKAYGEALEEDCNINRMKIQKYEKSNKENEAKIEAMLQVMGAQAKNVGIQNEEGRTK